VLVLVFFATGIRVFFARAVKIRLRRMDRAIAWLLAAILFAANWAYVIFYVG
jgi:hypothetical protein